MQRFKASIFYKPENNNENNKDYFVQPNLRSSKKINTNSTLFDSNNFPRSKITWVCNGTYEDDNVSKNKYFLGSILKSRSDSDLYLSDEYKNYLSRSRDLEMSSFPSDSDITVIRVQRRSKIQRIASRALEGILGDGSHLPESMSMVNLVTLVQLKKNVREYREVTSSSCTTKDDCLIPLSSWDRSEIDYVTNTVSDTTIESICRPIPNYWNIRHKRNSELLLCQTSLSSINQFYATRHPNKNASYKSLLKITNPKLKTIEIVDVVKKSSTNTPMIITDSKDGIKLQIIDEENSKVTAKAIRHSTRIGKIFTQFFTRIQSRLRRCIRCSCLPLIKK